MSFKKTFKDLNFLRNSKPSVVMVTSYYCQKFKDFIVCHLKNKFHFTTETDSSSLFEISETSIILCIEYQPPLKTPLPLSSQVPPLNLQTAQAPFINNPLKLRLFHEPQKY